MTHLRLHVQGDLEEARLREVLLREGFRFVEPPAGAAAEPHAVLHVGEEGHAEETRLEELERAVLELRNRDVAKSQFLANVSHELRTPLTAIVTYGEILRDGLLGAMEPRQMDAIEKMIGSGRQLLAMIEEVLTYARNNARPIVLQPVELPVSEVVAAVHDMNASLLSRKHLLFHSEMEQGLPPVRADRDKVVHILGNLVGNAIDFTPEGGTVRVSARRAPGRPGWVEVLVEDTGVGIDPEHHELIFREFAQVDASRARIHHGTGLGLAIARQFVRLHRGEIWVDSRLGQGSRFYFTLPCADSADEARPS